MPLEQRPSDDYIELPFHERKILLAQLMASVLPAVYDPQDRNRSADEENLSLNHACEIADSILAYVGIIDPNYEVIVPADQFHREREAQRVKS